MNPKYNKGRRNEYKVRKILTDKGYQVFRSAGSKGPWDLLAMGKFILCIQVKTNRLPGKAEMKRLIDTKVHSVAWRQVWVMHDRKAKPDIVTLDEGHLELDRI